MIKGVQMKALLIACCVFALSSIGIVGDTNFIQTLTAQITKDIKGERPHRLVNPTYTLLAFVSLEDERPLYVEEALLLIKDETRWILAHVVRTPRHADGRPGSKWYHHHAFDAPWTGDRVFKEKPTKEEVSKFLKETRWQWHSDPDWFDVVGRAVNDEAWIKLLDMPPPVSNADTKDIKQPKEVLDSNT